MSKQDWNHVSIGDIAEINKSSLRNNTPKDFEFDYIDIASITRTGVIENTKKLTFGDAPSRARRVVREGDTIISTVRPYLKAFAFIEEDYDQQVCSTGFAVLTPKEATVDSRYLYQTILSDNFVEYTKSKMTGSNYPAINASDVKEYIVYLPPLQVQKKISAILFSVDEAIEKTEAIIAQTKEVKKGLMQQLLTKGIGHTKFKRTEIGEIPEEWNVVALGEIAEFINGRGFKPHEWSTSGFPIIRIQNLNGGQDFNYYEGEFNPKILVEPETLLFAWSGSRGTSFGPHIWKGPTGVLNYHTWKVVNREHVVKEYLYYALRKITTKIENDSHGASALVHMQKSAMEIYKIALPSLAEQRRIAAVLLTIDSKAENGNAQLEKLKLLKKGLMQSLLTGKVCVKVDEVEVTKV
ncbi:restriction endonuclease subunit S [Neobacillus sp. LXY-1]|uniref:restriction endonuclease subunit S n=1 Tax=Neobacillus sp. LXY-1 TaxID=3379133 RepID=UPI003EE247E5